jgi:hypothetical protein
MMLAHTSHSNKFVSFHNIPQLAMPQRVDRVRDLSLNHSVDELFYP